MGSTFDYVPIQLTAAFRQAQTDEKFQGWLKMQGAAMEIVFPIEDLPEVADSMFTKNSLATAEAKLTELYDNNSMAYRGEETVHRTMRFVYYIGEVFRRAFEGSWVAIPPEPDEGEQQTPLPGIDLPFTESIIKPTQLVGFALVRRTGTEITRVYGHMERAYNTWIEGGRPERTYRGTLREGD
ncbi:hypothetical protein LT337_09760 [Mycolicibacterium fortuitum]|nr:hypothetical protein LT337_09760 [Mycolicibacterium fortuitum]